MAERLQLKHIAPDGAEKTLEIKEGAQFYVGRGSMNDLSIPDEQLSRRHCFFETSGEKGLKIIDLNSANGTYVNSDQIQPDASHELNPGDVISVGDQQFKVIDPSSPSHQRSHVFSGIDLGLNKSEDNEEANSVNKPNKRKLWLLVWGVIAIAICAVTFIPVDTADTKVIADIPVEKKDDIHSIEFEKVDADRSGIFRYAMFFDGFSGELSIVCHDVPVNNRQIQKKMKLQQKAIDALREIFDDCQAFMQLDDEYSGIDPQQSNRLVSRRIRIVRGEKIKSVQVVNVVEPPVFMKLREMLETFSRNELGVWAIQYSREKLLELAEQSYQLGQSKYEEREVDYGNLAASVSAYSEAVFYLETVDPKPDWYDTLVQSRDKSVIELDKAYRETRFQADKALNTQNWELAREHLTILCQMVPEKTDDRYREAKAKLVDVEKRLKKGGSK
ncbi:MAG: FHA domain-containing protein [Kiritimatiellae bacterium]|nr:FHA domain-containing protein [Kiritimatiellia bacterium]